MENDIHHKIRHLRILDNAFWANQCTCTLPKMDQQNLAIIYRHMLHSVPGRCPNILGQPGTTPKRHGCHHPRHTTTRNETQTVEMRISPKRNRIPRIHHQQRRSQSRPYQNSSHMGLESTYQQKGNSGIHGILQLLPTLYKRIQQNSQTPVRLNQERCHLGMGKQRTNRL